MKINQEALKARPAERQLRWQDTEYYGLIFYGMGTFTGQDIGDGFAGPKTFFPLALDTDDWAETAAAANMKGLMIAAKYYDGFCLWPTETTDYSVKNSTDWLDGNGDLVKMTELSARKNGLKFGLYYPIWDRHEPSFRTADGSFNDFIIAQLTELLTGYGDIFELLLDDRCNDRYRFEVDWKRIYGTVRKLQPDCAITFRGPDGRYAGNSKGITRSSEWSVIPASFGYNEDGTVPNSVKQPKYGEMELDIGSSKAIKKETSFIWAPCEVLWPLRPHLFYRKDDDYSVKTKDKILDMYCRSVGNNSNLVVCLAPEKKGVMFDTDRQILTSTGHDLSITYGYNLVPEGKLETSSELSELYRTGYLLESTGCWSPAETDRAPSITVTFDEEKLFDKVVLTENIRSGQYVEAFEVYIRVKGKWKKAAEYGTIGHKRICQLKTARSDGVKVVFREFRRVPEICSIQIN